MADLETQGIERLESTGYLHNESEGLQRKKSKHVTKMQGFLKMNLFGGGKTKPKRSKSKGSVASSKKKSVEKSKVK